MIVAARWAVLGIIIRLLPLHKPPLPSAACLIAELVGNLLATGLLELTSSGISDLLLILVVLVVLVETELLLDRVDAFVEHVLIASTTLVRFIQMC